jgi:D-alanyl-D-alanine carboxypeptidase
MPLTRRFVLSCLAGFALAMPDQLLHAQPTPDLPASEQARLDNLVRVELESTGTPSASIAIVAGGRVVYRKAYGNAQISPHRAATSAMRYGIGSISKEFLAAALLMLESEGRIKLDDKVGQYIADLGPAGDVTLRQLLSHTAGVRDYYPQDFLFAEMLKPITRDELIDRWVRQPLDFAPGESWQYSNTGYVLAGAVLEQVSGRPLFEFLRSRIFVPLGMSSVIDNDTGRLGAEDAVGYTAFGLGPLQPARKEAPGWLFAAGELAMTAEDLARWDISIIDRTLMSAAAYQALEKETLLNNGAGTQYALGLEVTRRSDRRVLAHGGGVSGFTSFNTTYPEARSAIVVLTNGDTGQAAPEITQKMEDLLFVTGSPVDAGRRDADRQIFTSLRQGRIDRTLFSDNGNYYYTPAAVRDTAHSLSRLGKLKSFELTRVGTRGGMHTRVYDVQLTGKSFTLVVRAWPDGRIEQFMLFPK